MRDLITAATWFRDDEQRWRAQQIVSDRLADDRAPDECRYLLRLAWQLAMSYREVSREELVAYVRPEKLAHVDALCAAAERGHQAIDAWIARCEAELPLVKDRTYRDSHED